jgi:hypothetical protein
MSSGDGGWRDPMELAREIRESEELRRAAHQRQRERSTFTEEQRVRILEHVLSKGISDAKCALCGHSDWTLGNGISHLLVPDERFMGAPMLGPAYRCLPFICTNCGNTHLLNVTYLGIDTIVEKAGGA